MRLHKEIIIESIKRLPDDCSIDDIMYRVYVIDKVLKGLEDVKYGRMYTQEEMEMRMEKWVAEQSGHTL